MADCGKPRNRGFVGGQIILWSSRQDPSSYVFQLQAPDLAGITRDDRDHPNRS